MTWLSVTRGPMGFLNIPAPQFEWLGGLRLAGIGQKYWLVALVAAANGIVKDLKVQRETAVDPPTGSGESVAEPTAAPT